MAVDGYGNRPPKTGSDRSDSRSDLGCGSASREHTNLIIDRRPPLTPPGTTFNAVKDAGAEMAPTEPESPIKVSPLGPEPVTPPSGKK